jgi:uncharacterized protein YoxC
MNQRDDYFKSVTHFYSQSSKISNCFNKGNLAGIAKCLSFYGFTPIPLRARKNDKGEIELDYTENRKDYQLQEDLEERIRVVRKEFSKKEIVGIALRSGIESNLLVLDIDDPEKFEAFYSIEKLIEEAKYVIQTKDEGHYHIGFLYDEDFPNNIDLVKEAGFEIKSKQSLVNFYTTLVDFQYTPLKLEPLKPMPHELKLKIKELIAKKQQKIETQGKELTPEQKEKIEKVLNKLYELTGYQPRQRKENIWRGKCPCHDDEEPSLDVEFINGRIRFKCWAGCSEEEITRALGYEDSTERKLKYRVISFTAAVRKEKEQGESEYLIDGILKAKGIYLLVARPKCGKTEFLCLLVSKILKEEPLFGNKTKRVKILWITGEDTLESIERRLKEHHNVDQILLETTLCTIETENDVFTGFIPKKELIILAKEACCQLIILEPLTSIAELASLGSKGRLTYEAIYNVFIPLQRELKREGILLLGAHHMPKGKLYLKNYIDLIEAPLGSSTYAGVADGLIGLSYVEGAPEQGEGSIRRILGKGRGFDFDYMLEWKQGRYVEKGITTEKDIITGEQKRIIEALQELQGEATPKELARILGKKEEVLYVMLHRMQKEGIIYKTKRGSYSIFNPKEILVKDVKDENFVKVVKDVKDVKDAFGNLNKNLNNLNESLTQSLTKQSLDISNIETNLNNLNNLNKNFSTTKPETPFWRIRVKNTICPKCTCNEWEIKVNPYEHTGALVFAECLNCSFERTIDLRDFEIIEEKPDEDIPF